MGIAAENQIKCHPCVTLTVAPSRDAVQPWRAASRSCSLTQGFVYAPFGEITTEFNASFGNGIIPNYTFNAKELDEETGMYYYEARYYQPPVFVSRDAMFEKYFWMSPYHYCSNNPMNKVDPTRM